MSFDENEVTEVTENEQEVQAELERQEQLEREERERLERERLEREQAEQERLEQERIEHENYLKSFPETTVFYDRILEKDDVKWLGQYVKDAYVADRFGWLENHLDESELTLIESKYYLKGYEPEETPETIHEKILNKIKLIDKQLEQYMDDVVHQKDYMNVVSCISYFNSTDEVFRTQARAVLRWRDEIYQVGRDVRDKVLAGELDWTIIDMDYILDRVEPLDW